MKNQNRLIALKISTLQLTQEMGDIPEVCNRAGIAVELFLDQEGL